MRNLDCKEKRTSSGSHFKLQLNGLVEEGNEFFSFKSAWIFACAFQLSRKTFSCIAFLAEMLLFCFVEFIVHAWIFCLCFSQKQSANQAKKYRGMLYYLIEKHMQKFRHFWRKTNFTWKSHLHPSCTKPFNCSVPEFICWSLQTLESVNVLSNTSALCRHCSREASVMSVKHCC